jgi:K+/H+ antiporter YhaU regulatory subunit KhtT
MEPDQIDLPGVGTRFTLPLSAGGRLEIVVHGPEQREVYFFRGENEPSTGFRLDAGEACALATLLCDALARAKEA